MKYVYQLFLCGQRNLHVGLSFRAIQVQHKHVKAGGLSPTLPTYMSRLPARDEDDQENPGNDNHDHDE